MYEYYFLIQSLRIIGSGKWCLKIRAFSDAILHFRDIYSKCWVQCVILHAESTWNNMLFNFRNYNSLWRPSSALNVKRNHQFNKMKSQPLQFYPALHYNDVIIGTIASQITSLTIVYSTVYSDADQRKYQSSASLAFVRGIHRWPVNSPHKWPVTRKTFPFGDVIMASDLYYIRVLRGKQLQRPRNIAW